MTKICFLSSAHPKFDKRVFQKEAVFLARSGHDVSHVCPDETAETFEKDGVTVKTYCRRGGLWGRLVAMPKLFSLARREKADALHANEFDSWIVALLVKFVSRTRVVFDVHEFYPSMFAETRMPSFLVRPTESAFRLIYRLLGPRTDLIVLANRYIRRDFPEKGSEIVMVENFATLETVKKIETLELDRTPSDRLKLIHVGLMARERGSAVLPEAMELIDPGTASLSMIGRMTDIDNETYRQDIAARGLDDRIGVTDWLPYDELLRELVDADVGIVFFQSGSETNAYGLPHKLFDYMAAGLPVLVSTHATYVAEIVTEVQCGVILDSEKPQEIADAIKHLAANRDEAKEYGRNGRAALAEKFNWESQIEKLDTFYRSLDTNKS